jgi:hypothetical protein
MRLTYKKLAQIISDKLKSVEVNHVKVEAYNPRHQGHEIEGGAATIIYKIYVDQENYFTMFAGQWISEIQQIVSSKNYQIAIDPKSRFTLSDGHIWFRQI